MNHKDTIERRETTSQAKEGDREEERLNESQGYNRKERDETHSTDSLEPERSRDSLTGRGEIKERKRDSLIIQRRDREDERLTHRQRETEERKRDSFNRSRRTREDERLTHRQRGDRRKEERLTHQAEERQRG